MYLANSIHVSVTSLFLLVRDLLALLLESTFNSSCFSSSIIPDEEKREREGERKREREASTCKLLI